jgi:lysophospholipase L1-like esterase
MTTLSLPAGSTLLFEGDSITAFRVAPLLDTWAWMRLSGAHYGYPERVGDWLFCQRPQLRLQVRDGAIAGSASPDLLARFDAHVAPLRPAVVVMTMGPNDVSRSIAPEQSARAIGEFAARLDRLCGGRVLHLGGAFSPQDTPSVDAERHQRLLATWRAVRGAVAASGGMALDAYGVLARRHAVLRELYQGHSIFHDGTHLNAVGHEIMAGIVLRALGFMEVPGEEPLV